jgi:type II secretory pathway predicted ATPase ExeA
MIEVFYKLKRLPFQKDINPKDMFAYGASEELARRLEHMKQKRGLMLITGAPGTGKTLHIRAFVDKLNPNLFKPVYTPLATVNILDFYRQLSVLLGGEPLYRKSQLFHCIQSCIRNYVADHKKAPVIIFDEAHLLKIENFYELQIITNFNMDSADPALFVLVGQAHLRERLLIPVLQPFNQRIALKCHLPALSREESASYIHHQLSLAGLKTPVFNENALNAVYQNSGGVPRMINALCLKTLTIGALEKKEVLSEDEVFRATHEL